MEDLVLSIATPSEFDLELFQLWVAGKSAEEAFAYKLDFYRKMDYHYGLEFRGSKTLTQFDQADCVRFEVIDQYRAFELLEHFLAQPVLLRSQCLVVLRPEYQSYLIDSYWSVDDSFLREVLNKRLARSRKDLEDAAEITDLNLRSVTRQYDNIKRVFNAYEDPINIIENNLYTFCTKNFLLGPQLARKYACIIFLLVTKFNLTSKKRLLNIDSENLELCAALILAFLALDSSTFFTMVLAEEAADEDERNLLEDNALCWTVVWKIFPDVDPLDPDKQLLANLRDVRGIVTGETLDVGVNSVRYKMGQTLASKLDPTGSSRLRNIVKSLLALGANMSQSREFRDLFEDVLTKIAEPLEDAGLSKEEILTVVGACYYIASDIPEGMGRSYSVSSAVRSETSGTYGGNSAKMNRMEMVKKDWLRFITFVKLCLTQLL